MKVDKVDVVEAKPSEVAGPTEDAWWKLQNNTAVCMNTTRTLENKHHEHNLDLKKNPTAKMVLSTL